MSEQSNTLKAKAASLSIRQVIGFETPEEPTGRLSMARNIAFWDRVMARAVLHLVGFVMVAVWHVEVDPTLRWPCGAAWR